MNQAYNGAFSRWFLIVLSIGVLLNLALWTGVYLFFPKDTPAAVLHYSAGVGIDFIGEGRRIIMLPLAGLVLLGMNVILGLAVHRVSLRAAWLFWGIIPPVQFILLLAFYLLWRFNS